LVERWRVRPLRSIDGHDIWSVIDEARRVGVPGIDPRTPGLSEARPRALLAALSAMCTWARQHRLIDANPCSGLHRPATPKARDRVLSTDEICWFWWACDSVDAPRVTSAPRPFAPLLRLLLITGARLNEVAAMTKDELSEDGATWNLPGDRTKNHRPHVAPLPPLARELIENVQSKQGSAGYIFSTTGHSPVSGWSRAKDRLDQAMLKIARKERGKDVAIEPWRFHDLRRSFVTGLIELGVQPHVVELAVNHISGTRAGVAGIYNKSEMLPERRDAFERWSRYIALLIDRNLYAAHRKFVGKTGDENRDKEREEIFKTALATGGDRWSRYLKMITAGGPANVRALRQAR
jgi:integrase